MADEVVKQEIRATNGTFDFSGIISNLDKEQDVNQQTKKGNSMRTLVFNVDTAEGHSHRMQLRAYQGEFVYYSKTNVDKDGNRKTDIQKVKWGDREKFDTSKGGKFEGYLPIDRVAFHNGNEKDDSGKEKKRTSTMPTYDAIPEILKEFSVGDSVRIVGNIQIEDYTLANGNSGTAVRLIPTRIFHSSKEIDFKAEDFTEVANFNQKILVDEVEETGTKEITVTGIIIGNQRMGRQDFIFRDKAYDDYNQLLNTMKNFPKYVSIELKGILNNGAAKEEAPQFVEIKGIKVPLVQSRPAGNSFVREFLTTAIVTGESAEHIDWGDTYTEQNVQEFINNFIRAKDEYGESTATEETTADDFTF